MAKAKRTLTAAGVTRETLEETPQRAIQFLAGVAGNPGIYAILSKRGYTPAEHSRGWKLIEKAATRLPLELVTDEAVIDAIAQLDKWDEKGIRLLSAGLTRYPKLRAKVLDGIEAAEGPQAVLVVSTLLDRVDALAGSKAGDEDGDAALATLEQRNLGAAERQRLRGLIKRAQTARPLADGVDPEQSDAAYEQALLALREWVQEWSEFAREDITRRDYLIRLGLAERRSPGTAGKSEPEDGDIDPTGPGGPFLPDPKPGE